LVKTISDPVFGSLQWDWYWEGKADVPALGGTIDLKVEAADEDALPSQDQRRVFRAFVADAGRLRPEIERALLEYYQRVRPIYQENASHYPGGFDRAMPVLASGKEIWPLLMDASVMVPEQQDGDVVVVAWNCS
jgi:hypothetical protein